MIKKAFAIGIVSAFLAMFGCAPMVTVVKVDVAYLPSNGPAKPQITLSKRIRIEPIVDKRWNMALGEIREQGKTIGMYMSNTDVPKVITEAVKAELTNQGYQVVSERGDLVLSGDLLALKGKRIQGFFLRGTFEAAAQARMTLRDASGNAIWSDVVNGRSELKYGPLTKPNERFVEAIDSAITDLIERLVGLESFRSALM
ncbi:MAG: YajG family lipoprotein [bacterium]